MSQCYHFLGWQSWEELQQSSHLTQWCCVGGNTQGREVRHWRSKSMTLWAPEGYVTPPSTPCTKSVDFSSVPLCGINSFPSAQYGWAPGRQGQYSDQLVNKLSADCLDVRPWEQGSSMALCSSRQASCRCGVFAPHWLTILQPFPGDKFILSQPCPLN